MKNMATRRLFLMALVVMTIMALAAPARAATYGGGSGTVDDPFRIDTKEHLEALREAVNAGTKYQSQFFKMTRDIDLEKKPWTPIGNASNRFRGTFDGGGHAIAGLKVDMNVTGFSDVYAGLFGYVDGGTISRLSVSGEVTGTTTSYSYAGGIAGELDGGTIEACSFTGTVKAEVAVAFSVSRNAHAGGIAGAIESGSTVTGCTVYGASITASIDTPDPSSFAAAGGIVGRLGPLAPAEKITDCVAEATVRATHTRELSHAYVGGILGWSEGQGLSNILSDNVYHGNAANGIGQDLKSGKKPSNAGAARATGPSILTAALPGGTAGTWWRRDLAAAPSGSKFSWSAKGLPKGLELDKKTGVIKGIPEKTGTYTIEVTVTSEGQTATRSYQIVIAKPGRFAIEGEDDLPGALVGQSYSHALTTTGGRAASWKIEDGDLAKGMKFSEKTGKITGTPKEAGEYAFVVTAEKTDGTTASRKLTLKVLEGVGPAAPEGLVATPPTARGLSDGTISGVDAGMEWSADGGETWTDCPTSGPITGLAPGAYLVRVKETATTKAGESATVTVPESGAHVVEIRLTDGGDGGPAVVLELTSNGEPVAGMDLWAWLVPTDGGAEQGAFLGTTDEAGRLVIDVDALVWATGDRAGEKASIPAGTWRIRIEIRDASGDLWTGVSSDAVSLPATSPIGSSGGCGNVGFGALAMIACASLILRRRS